MNAEQLTVRKLVVFSLLAMKATVWFICAPYSCPNCSMLERCRGIIMHRIQYGFVLETEILGAQQRASLQGVSR